MFELKSSWRDGALESHIQAWYGMTGDEGVPFFVQMAIVREYEGPAIGLRRRVDRRIDDGNIDLPVGEHPSDGTLAVLDGIDKVGAVQDRPDDKDDQPASGSGGTRRRWRGARRASA